MGFTRDTARRALQLGWSKEDVEATQEAINGDGYTVFEVFTWGVLVGVWNRPVTANLLVYRGENSFRPWSEGAAVCYTDGSGTTAKKTAGIGVYVENEGQTRFIAENIGLGTNNVAELCAVWRALREFPYTDKELLIKSDSEYAIGIITNPTWLAQVNTDLVQRIREDYGLRKNVRLEHVDGHKGIAGNEIADGLSKIGRKYVSTTTRY